MFRIMSDVELTRLQVLRDLDKRAITAAIASQLLRLERRQVFRLLKAYRTVGVDGLISKRRGRPSNRSKPDEVRSTTMALVRERYPDFGPTFAAEKLRELHGIELARETLRNWMIADGLWIDRNRRHKRVHQPRYRRDCVGELIQIDGSDHRWFEGRAPACTLLVFIDDATSRLMHLQFVETESAFAYFTATRSYIEAHGKPVAFYSDKHSVFRVSNREAVSGTGMTQFGRALHSLNIDIICANSSQAKGRVERANKTLQDRLVKDLRLADARSIADGNAFLPGFLRDFNGRFAKVPANEKDLHRPLLPTDRIDDEFAWQVERTLSQSLTIQYDKVMFIIEPTPEAKDAIGKKVTVIDYPDGRLVVRYQGVSLAYRIFDKIRAVQQADIIENKRLGPLLEMIRQQQLEREPVKRSSKGPKRRDQKDARMFKTG